MRNRQNGIFPVKSILFGMTLFVLGAQAHGAILFSDSFESGDLSHAENGFGWNGAQAGTGDVQPTVTTAIAHSGTHSVKFTFGGSLDITDDAWSELGYKLGANMNEVYMQFYQYYPSGAENPSVGPKWYHRSVGASNNKFFKLWADNYSNYTVATGISTNPTADGHDIFFVEYGTNQLAGGVDGHGAMPNFIANDSNLGRWLKIQIRIKCATAANNDGVEEMWVDDKRVMSNTNLPLYPAGGIGNYLRNGYLMGWMNSGFNLTSSTYIDDVTISDSYIGGNPLKPPVAQ